MRVQWMQATEVSPNDKILVQFLSTTTGQVHTLVRLVTIVTFTTDHDLVLVRIKNQTEPLRYKADWLIQRVVPAYEELLNEPPSEED